MSESPGVTGDDFKRRDGEIFPWEEAALCSVTEALCEIEFDKDERVVRIVVEGVWSEFTNSTISGARSFRKRNTRFWLAALMTRLRSYRFK